MVIVTEYEVEILRGAMVAHVAVRVPEQPPGGHRNPAAHQNTKLRYPGNALLRKASDPELLTELEEKLKCRRSDNEEKIEIMVDIHDDPFDLPPVDINQINAWTQQKRAKQLQEVEVSCRGSDKEEKIEVVGDINDDPFDLSPVDINLMNALTQPKRANQLQAVEAFCRGSDNEEKIEVGGDIHDDPSDLPPMDINQINALIQLKRAKNN